MPKIVRIGHGESRPDDRSPAPGAPGCLYAPLKAVDHLRMMRAAFGRRGWFDVAIIFVSAIVLVGMIIAIGPEVARP